MRGNVAALVALCVLIAMCAATNAHATGQLDPTLSSITSVPVYCYSQGEWAEMIAAPNVIGMTITVWRKGVLVGGPTIELPQSICVDAPRAPRHPTFSNVFAARVVGHEWGNAYTALHGIDNTGEHAAACYGQRHFWSLIDKLGQVRDYDSLTMTAESIPPTTGCFTPHWSGRRLL